MEEGSKPILNADDIREGTLRGAKKYNDLNFLEKFAMYLGISQILEIGLKNLLEDKFGYDPN